MIVTCADCNELYDDAYRWTICPHNWLHNDSDRSIDDPRRIGGWIQTYTGKKVYPLDPRPEDIEPTDIAHALARICRFGGHVKCDHYSVAQHSVLVSYEVEPGNELVGLLHDAAEAYLGDVMRPLKQELVIYQLIEKRWELILDYRFGFAGKLFHPPPDIKRADNVLLATERRDVMSDGPQQNLEELEGIIIHRAWTLHEKPREEVIEPWSPSKARDMFLGRWLELKGDLR